MAKRTTPSRRRGCETCGGILLGRRTRWCSSCAPVRRHESNPLYGSRQWKRTVKAVRLRDGNRCQHCGTTEGRLVVDHKVPHDRYPGSFFDLRNLWLLCSRDNNSKRDLSADEWLAALARRRPTSRTLTADYTRRPKYRARSVFGPSPYSFGGRR